MNNTKKSTHLIRDSSIEQNSFLMELKMQNYPLNSVPIKMTLGKIKKVDNQYQPRLNLSFLEKNIVYENSYFNLKSRPIYDVQYWILKFL